ncbi:MAG: hypothetical protein FWF94_06195 [Oscillospiraceae bacterium]|nr:hypothetical protein [Oscillospiraceae bacterium]
MANTNQNVSDSDTTPTTPTPPPKNNKAKPKQDGITQFVYVGMSVGRLQNSAVIQGSHKQITEHYSDEIAVCPDIVHLIVPVSKLSATRAKIKTSGNALNEYYSRVAAQVNKAKKEPTGEFISPKGLTRGEKHG